MANTYDILITQGESFSLQITAKDASGIAMNLSGYSVSGRVKMAYSDTGVLLNLNPSISDAASGGISVNLAGAMLTGLPITEAFYSIDIYSGSYVQNILFGNFSVGPCVLS